MAAAIKQLNQVEAQLIPGKGGVFDVVVDGNRIWNMQDSQGEFPTDDQILTQLA